MLKCNLAVLLAERKLKISKVSADTGVSRTTLTALSSNNSQGIQFDTLNTLCSYLRVTPADFFCYVPFECQIDVAKSEPPNFEIELVFVTAQGKRLGLAKLLADIESSDGALKDERDRINITTMLNIFVSSPEDNVNLALLNRYLKGLPPVFKSDIEQIIGKIIVEQYEQLDPNETFEFDVTWCDNIF